MAKRDKNIKFDYATKDNDYSHNGIYATNFNSKQSIKNMLAIFVKVFNYIEKYKNILILGLVLAILSSTLMMIGPSLVKQITDIIEQGLHSELDFDAICRIAISLCIIYLLSAVCSFVQQYTMASATANVCKKFRSDFINKLNKLTINYFHHHIQGDILSIIANDIQTLYQGISRSLPKFIKAIAQLVTCVFIMLITEWHLTLCVFSIITIILGCIVLLMKFSQKYFNLRQHNLGALNGFIEEMYTGYQVIKMTCAKDKVINKFNEGNMALYNSEYKAKFISGIMPPLMIAACNLSVLVVVVVGSSMSIQGIITFGSVVAFVLLSYYFIGPLAQITVELGELQSICAAAIRMFDFLEAKEEKATQNAIDIKSIDGKVEFENVCFSYPSNKDKIVLNNFSAKINPGQKVAIVGHTGSGKTTLVNLLMRFYEVNSGDIKIDDVSIKNININRIHELFGMVLQDTWLFEGTIRDNLTFNIKNVSDKKILEICKLCGIYDFVMKQVNGLDTKITSNISISAGQKQLFTITRAILQNAPMLILDEATSSIDTRTEEKIQESIDKLTAGKTCFVIAHRLSTIKNADCILVIENGTIVESGTHNELIALKNKYFSLYKSQFEEA